MPIEITYVPIGECRTGEGFSVDEAGNLGRRLREKLIPACHIRRVHGSGLDVATEASKLILERGVLPVVEVQPGDSPVDLRILGETCCVGTLLLAWHEGTPSFDETALLETVNSAGRHRLPLDLWIDPGNGAPEMGNFKKFVDGLGKLALKYGHIQDVTLTGSHMEMATEAGREEAVVFHAILKACPRALPSVAAGLWLRHESARKIANDLGYVTYPVEEGPKGAAIVDPVSAVAYKAKSLGSSVMPRLPLTPRLYRLGWFSFEVGKVLDSWVDRKAFNAYKGRPGWLEF